MALLQLPACCGAKTRCMSRGPASRSCCGASSSANRSYYCTATKRSTRVARCAFCPRGPNSCRFPYRQRRARCPGDWRHVARGGYDFGTASLDQAALDEYTADLGAGYLPPVVFGAPLGTWTSENNPAFQVPIPAMDVFYLVRDEAGGLVFPILFLTWRSIWELCNPAYSMQSRISMSAQISERTSQSRLCVSAEN